MSKLERTLEDINNVVCDYDEYLELDDWGKAHLLDDLIDLMGDLKSKDITEGVRYEGFMYLVKQGEPIPQPFTTVKVQGIMSEQEYEIQVKMVTELKWNSNGDLVLELIGRKIR